MPFVGGGCQLRTVFPDCPRCTLVKADGKSENDIMAEIRALARRRTVIVITHRLANVTDADSIYVLEAGTVAGHGPHAALLAQGGLYKTLWDRQQELEHFGTEEVSA